MDKDDLAITKEFLRSPEAVAKGLDILNTRTFKKQANQYLLTVGSINVDGNCVMHYKDKIFTVEFGEFSAYLKEMNGFLEKALPYVANETQQVML